MIRQLIVINLELAGFEVAEATDAKTCLSAVASFQPDLITMDINMPGLNGLELAARLRSTPGRQHIPIVIVTARTHPLDRATAERLGVRAYLTKPFEPDELVGCVERMVDSGPA